MPISNGHSNQWYRRFLPYLIALCSTSIAFGMVDENSPIHRESVSQSLIYEAATSYDDQVFTKQTLRSAWRSQRDLSMNISINRIQWPAINLASGFFGNNYTDVKVLNIASVLQAGYRRLVLDLYWQSDRGNWQLCPTNIPDAAFSQRLALTPELGKAISAQNRTVTHSSSLSTTPSSPPPTASPERKVKTLAPSKLLATKDEMFSNGVQLQADVTVSSYTCTPWITFRHFMQSIDVYLNSVDPLTNSEHTDLVFLILNLHSLNSTSTQTPPSVNTNSTWIGNMSNNQSLSLWETIDSTVGKSLLRTSKVYTPQNLTSDRANLTASFNTTGMPYYIAQTNADTHTLTTNTGWPPWLYLIQKQIQLLVGFGDNFLPSNTNYNVADDGNFIFDQSALNGGSLMSTINVTSMASTGWTNCSVPGGNNFMVPSGNETTELVGGVVTGGNQVSWSWAYMTDQGSPFDYYSGNNAVSLRFISAVTNASFEFIQHLTELMRLLALFYWFHLPINRLPRSSQRQFKFD